AERAPLEAEPALAAGEPPLERVAEALRALEEESRADKRERRQLDAAHAEALAELSARITALATERDALESLRASRSTEYLEKIQAGYSFRNFVENSPETTNSRSLRSLFAPELPPGGAGDCAAPKLLARARDLRLAPIALAELWWGAPPKTGGRRAGEHYAACRAKCGPILAFVLRGLDVDPAPVFGADPSRTSLELPVVFEDRWLVVVDKPSGLLSVPGRGVHLADSVATRLRARDPAITGLVAAHRLDLDTSGLLVCAKDERTWSALQKQFAARDVDKRYVAWLDGDVRGDHGVVELALRVDVDDRPRQIHDPIHGKPACTEWRVIERRDGRTKVALVPKTGRTHQLRVHAAHPLGLDAPITGDRLYGRAAERLMLHAEAIAFTHPHTGARITLERPAPF
ncbi:RluA family pseudouridine synthase, partial [Myxococcota bacterium]|nr:RluA family pseudouridine synthase [Myxococcota bacterium]